MASTTKIISVAILLLGMASNAYALYGAGDSMGDLRFGANIGAGSGYYNPDGPSAGANVGFGGHAGLSCSGLNYQAYIRSINPNEVVKKYIDVYTKGAQAAAFNYLLSLAYSNPTVASILDTMNNDYSQQFSAFAKQCSLDEAKRMGAERGARKMAEAKNECYESQVKAGVGAAQAYDNCKSESSAFSYVAIHSLPASKAIGDFLKDYTNIDVNQKMDSMLGLFGDQVVTSNGLEMKPPKTTIYAMNENVARRTRIALQMIMNGMPGSSIRNCTGQDLMDPPMGANNPADACLPAETRGVVATPGFAAANQLEPGARNMYVDALSSQIAIASIRDNLVNLENRIVQLTINPSADVSTDTVEKKKKELLGKISAMQGQADALQRLQVAKSQIAKTQIASLQQVMRQNAAVAAQVKRDTGSDDLWWTPQSILRNLLRLSQ